MSLLVLPFFTDPSWHMATAIEGSLFNFQFDWNERGACWYMSLADTDGVDIYNGVKLLTGFALLRKCKDLRKPPGDFFVLSSTSDLTPPGQFDLVAGGKNELLYVTSDWLATMAAGGTSGLMAQLQAGPGAISPISTYGQAP